MSDAQTPLDKGALVESRVSSVDGMRGAVAYRDWKAPIVHEDLAAQHDAGREAKFLEKALASERHEAGKLIARSIRREIER